MQVTEAMVTRASAIYLVARTTESGFSPLDEGLHLAGPAAGDVVWCTTIYDNDQAHV